MVALTPRLKPGAIEKETRVRSQQIPQKCAVMSRWQGLMILVEGMK